MVPKANEPGPRREPLTTPTLSVVIPVKDDSALLRRCLESIARQSHPPDEIIVVDNDSADRSAAVAEQFGVRLLSQPEHGILAASALGYDAARGEIIARLDADCVAPEDWLERIVAAFSSDPTLGAATGGAFLADGPQELRPVLSIYLGAYHATLLPALGHHPLFGSNMAMRRDAWTSVSREVHRHDSDVHDDLDLAFHLGRRHRIRRLPGIAVGISARPFQNPSAVPLRIRRGLHTVWIHWPAQFPPLRWYRIARNRIAPGPARGRHSAR